MLKVKMDTNFISLMNHLRWRRHNLRQSDKYKNSTARHRAVKLHTREMRRVLKAGRKEKYSKGITIRQDRKNRNQKVME